MKSNADWESRAIAAQKTVEVLKAKVRSLYDGESASAMQRQVERSKRRTEGAQRRREMVELKAAELARYSESLEHEVKDRTRDIRTILDNVTNGFLIIGRDLIVRAGYTQSCLSLFDTDCVAGRQLADLLRISSEVGRIHLSMAVEEVFEDVMPEEASLELIPRRYPIGDRIVRLDARAIRDNGQVMSLLLTFNDITSLELAQRQARINHVLIGILKQRAAFQSFAVEARSLFINSREALTANDHVYARRALHTIKGNSASFDLANVVETVHNIESQEVITTEDVDKAENALRAFFKTHVSILEMSYDALDDECYEVTRADFDALRAVASDPMKIDDWTHSLVMKRVDQVAGPLSSYVEKLGERLEKSVEFSFLGSEVLVDARRLRPVLQNLGHVLRNAIDHGIEKPNDRGDKRPRGKVDVVVTDEGENWTISVCDDGRGIDPDHVAKRALAKGFVGEQELTQMSRDEKVRLIFVDGFSTAEITTDVSGRGIGMSAVKAAVEETGGRVEVESAIGSGTKVRLVIPKPRSLQAGAAAA